MSRDLAATAGVRGKIPDRLACMRSMPKSISASGMTGGGSLRL
jgi:hypothetical protein